MHTNVTQKLPVLANKKPKKNNHMLIVPAGKQATAALKKKNESDRLAIPRSLSLVDTFKFHLGRKQKVRI